MKPKRMKAKWMGLALALFSSFAAAQVGELYDANITERTAITDPVKAVSASEGQWLAFSLPVLEGTRSPCCWKGQWNRTGGAGCSLKSTHQSYGMTSDSPLADTVIVYNEIRGGQVNHLRVVGVSCPVDGHAADVTWIGSVEEKAGLDWLEDVARSGEDDQTPRTVRRQALFWLANSGNDSTVAALTNLLTH